MKTRTVTALMAVCAVALIGCSDDNPAGTGGHTEEALTFTITASATHAHTLDALTFTVAVTTHEGVPVTDFEQIALERSLHGQETFRAIDLTLVGDVYEGTYTFTTSGAYDLRVVGVRHAGHELEEMYRMAEHFEVGRAHVESGGYRVEYESDPGHIHEGDASLVMFWVREADPDPVSGERLPIGGLAPTGECKHASGLTHDLPVWSEPTAGAYEVSHTFTESGSTELALFFTGSDGLDATARFQIEVAHGH